MPSGSVSCPVSFTPALAINSAGPFQEPSWIRRVSTAPPKDEPTINRVSGRMAARARSMGTRKSSSIWGQVWSQAIPWPLARLLEAWACVVSRSTAWAP